MNEKLRCVAIRESLHRKVKLEAVKRGTTIIEAVEFGLKVWLKDREAASAAQKDLQAA